MNRMPIVLRLLLSVLAALVLAYVAAAMIDERMSWLPYSMQMQTQNLHADAIDELKKRYIDLGI